MKQPLKALLTFVIASLLISCENRSKNEDYILPDVEDVNFNDYDTTNYRHADKVLITEYGSTVSSEVYIGKSTPEDIIRLFGPAKIDTSFDEVPTTSDRHDLMGKGNWIEYKDLGLSFSFHRWIRDGETNAQLLASKDSCPLAEVYLIAPSHYYLDNVYNGMTFGAVKRKFGKESWFISKGIVYDSLGLHLTFDKEIYKNDTTARLENIERTERQFFN